MVAHREIYHQVAMAVFLVVIWETTKPGGEAAHADNVCVLLEVCARPCLSAALSAPSSSNIAVQGKPHPLRLFYLLMKVSPKAVRCKKEHSFLLVGMVKVIVITQNISCVLCVEEVNKLYNLRSHLAKFGCSVLKSDCDRTIWFGGAAR